MKNILYSVLVSTLMVFSIPGSIKSATYYICDCQTNADPDCVPGDDANPGTSAEQPWKTYDKAQGNFASLEAGDTIAFARGGSFTSASTSSRWVNKNSTAQKPCVVTAYTPSWASGDEPKPLLSAGFRLENGGNAEHEEGMVIEKLHLVGSGTDNGIFLYNDIDDVILDSLIIDNFHIGVHHSGSNPVDPGSNGKNERLTLRNSTILNNDGQGFLGAGDDLVIENCYFENNGFAKAVFNHNIYISGASDTLTKRIRVSNNTLYKSAIVNGECAGVSLVVHGQHDSMLIENNTVIEDIGAAGGGCWGIAVDGGYSAEEMFINLIIRGNTVINAGNMGIGVSSAINCIIENNIVIHQQDFGITAIAAPDRKKGDEDPEMTGVLIRNNTVYIDNEKGGTGIKLGDEGANHSAVSNAVVYTGPSNSFSGFNFNLDYSQYATIDNNLVYAPNAQGAKWESGTGSLADWQNASSFGTNSIAADPLFPDIVSTAKDLKIEKKESPLVNNGHTTLSSKIDMNGAARDTQPDIGAFEFNNVNPIIFNNGKVTGSGLSLFTFKHTSAGFFVSFFIEKEGYVSIDLFDCLGRKKQTLVSKLFLPGLHEKKIAVNKVGQGVYLMRLRTAGSEVTRKVGFYR